MILGFDTTPETATLLAAIAAVVLLGTLVWRLLPDKTKAFLVAIWPFVKAILEAIKSAGGRAVRRIRGK